MSIKILIVAIGATTAASFLVILLCKYFRSRVSVKVNCWFCGEFHLVPYGNKNCWDCPHCEQYNGFNEAGDYNKPIPAQYDEYLNPNGITASPSSSRSSLPSRLNACPSDDASNGLCGDCNRNQLLKIKQLAQFVPQADDCFDDEVELYRQHLESAYKLCRFCEAVVGWRLENQDSLFRSRVLSWRLQQKQSEISPQLKRQLLRFSSRSNVPFKARFLRFVSIHVAFVFLISYLGEIEVFSVVETYIPQSVVDFVVVLGEHHQLLVAVGFFSLISAIFTSGRDKLMRIDAIGSFVWLAHLFLHIPPFVAVFVHVVDLRFVQIAVSFACFVVTILSAASNRKRSVLVRSWNSNRLNSWYSPTGSDSSSIIYNSSTDFVTSKLHQGSYSEDGQSDAFSISSRRSKSPDDVQSDCSTTTTAKRNKHLPQRDLDSDLQAMKIGTPKKSEDVSGIFTCHSYNADDVYLRRCSILSPSRLKARSVTQSSWVAGGYWAKTNGRKFSGQEMNHGSSLFGGKDKTSHSCPVSRAGSVLCEDRFSVFSEPTGRLNNTQLPNVNSVAPESFGESVNSLMEEQTGSDSACSTSSNVSIRSKEMSLHCATATLSLKTPATFWRWRVLYVVFGVSLLFNVVLIASFILSL